MQLTLFEAAPVSPPSVVVWENVPGVLSSRDNAFGCFLGALAGEDAELEPESRPAAGRSSRYWRWDKKLGQHAPSWPNAGAVVGPARAIAWRVLDAQYFGLAQRRRRVFVVASARQGFDPASVLFEFDGVRRDSAPSREPKEDAAAGTLRGTDGGSDVDHARAGHLIAGTLLAGGKAAGSATQQDAEAGLLVVHGTQDPDVRVDLAHTLGRNNGMENAVLSVALRGREGGATAELGDDLAGCLRASSGGGDKPHVLADMSVRRLTPNECERLQGFPDGYTSVPHRGKTAADGPRYKALGNSMVVACMAWIGKRIKHHMESA